MSHNEEAIQHSMDVAESSRETEWEKPSFAAGLFLGEVDLSLIHPFPAQSEDDEKEAEEFLAKLEAFLIENVDAEEIDRTGEYPDEIFDGLRALGAFGMKIPKKYGGLGLSITNYNRAIGLVATHCASTVAWLSAHQSIGVPQPLTLFGTEEQKQKYLPRLAKGAISAFALTEVGVGSDPARMSTTATPSPDGKGWVINGQKLWCTNGLKAELIVVMAQTPSKVIKGKERKQISAFIVETDTKGFEIAHRSQFMGLRGIGNVLMNFNDVYVPNENLLWKEGQGLKLALITLNTGRLTIPAGCAAGARRALQITRDWANERVQWGMPIGYHEAIADKIAHMTANTFAAESIVWLTSGLADRGDVDLRIEAAMAKLFNTEITWELIDDLVQIRGGRGYETEKSLRDRGEKPWPVERMLRDSRINRIFEGTSEIQHLFIAREAVDPHMEYAQFMMQKDPSFGQLAKGAAKAGAHYATWYPKLFVPKRQGDYSQLGSLSGQMKWVEKTSRRLARGIFHAMSRYQQKLEKKQRILFRIVDIGVDLFAMSATITYATHLSKNKGRHNAIDLAEAFCSQARIRIDQTFDQLFSSNDKKEYKLVKSFLEGDYEWFEGRMVDFVHSTPEKVEEAIAEMAQ